MACLQAESVKSAKTAEDQLNLHIVTSIWVVQLSCEGDTVQIKCRLHPVISSVGGCNPATIEQCTLTCDGPYVKDAFVCDTCECEGEWKFTYIALIFNDPEEKCHCQVITCIFYSTCVELFTFILMYNTSILISFSDIDSCLSNPCVNNGVCVDGVHLYTCNCQPGFTGYNCETGMCFLWDIQFKSKNSITMYMYYCILCWSNFNFKLEFHLLYFRNQWMWQSAMYQWSNMFKQCQPLHMYMCAWLYRNSLWNR